MLFGLSPHYLESLLPHSINMSLFEIRKLITYQNSLPCPKNGCKCIVLDGIRYIIHIENNEIKNLYDAKYKQKKEDYKPLPEKTTEALIGKLANIFFVAGGVNLPDSYVFEIIHSNKGVLVTDILNLNGDNFHNIKYSSRINTLSELIESNSIKLRTISTVSIHNIDTSMVTTPTIVRYLSSVPNYGTDYLINPTETTYTYIVVGSAYLPKPPIVIKREPYIKVAHISNATKNLHIGNNNNVLAKLSKLSEEQQLEFYNQKKEHLFKSCPDTVTSLPFPNSQTQKVFLVAGVKKSKLSIFGYTKDIKKLVEDNVYIERPDILTWDNPEFESTFNHINYFKVFLHVVSKQLTKYNPNKLSVVSIISSTALSENTTIAIENFDNIPTVETNPTSNKTLNNTTNDEIFSECITRIGNNLLQSENHSLRALFQNLQAIKQQDSLIQEKFNDLITALEGDEHSVIKNVLMPLQNEITDVNHVTINKMNAMIQQLKRKRVTSFQQRQQKKMRFEPNNEDESSGEEV